MLSSQGKKSAGLLALAFVLAQVVPVRRTNPHADPASNFTGNLRLTREVHQMLQKACMDCHSNETRWPWYSYVAPVSWLVARDVEAGRRTLNLSEWTAGPGKQPAVAASTLATMCAAVKTGRMPRAPYGTMHPEARLTEREVETFCGWTSREFARLVIEQRKLRERTAVAHRQE